MSPSVVVSVSGGSAAVGLVIAGALALPWETPVVAGYTNIAIYDSSFSENVAACKHYVCICELAHVLSVVVIAKSLSRSCIRRTCSWRCVPRYCGSCDSGCNKCEIGELLVYEQRSEPHRWGRTERHGWR